MCGWVIYQDTCGYLRAREVGFHMLKASTIVKSGLGKPVETSRIRGTQPKQISKFYEYFETIRNRTDVRQQEAAPCLAED